MPDSQDISEDISDEPRPKKRARRSGRAAHAASARSRLAQAPNWLPQAQASEQLTANALPVAARVTRGHSTASSTAELGSGPRRGRRRLLDTANGRGALSLPFTEEQLVDSPFEQFAQMLTMPGLSESQLQLMKDIRRRGSCVTLILE